MAPVVTIVICVVAVLAVVAFGREMLAIVNAIGRGILEFKARLKDIEDDF